MFVLTRSLREFQPQLNVCKMKIDQMVKLLQSRLKCYDFMDRTVRPFTSSFKDCWCHKKKHRPFWTNEKNEINKLPPPGKQIVILTQLYNVFAPIYNAFAPIYNALVSVLPSAYTGALRAPISVHGKVHTAEAAAEAAATSELQMRWLANELEMRSIRNEIN